MIDQLLDYPMGYAVGIFSLSILELVIFLACFEWFTPYRCWDEIAKGNKSAGLATGGKIIAICIVLRSAVSSYSINEFILWSALGNLLLLTAYVLFEFLTPVFRIDREIKQGNTAAGIIALAIAVAVSLVVSACME